MLSIKSVLPGSVSEQAGLRAGDRIVSINGCPVRDVIDYQFLAADDRLTLVISRGREGAGKVRIAKHPDDMLGLEFAPFPVRRCRNKCQFCFVDQMPPDCRKSLYVKDDDYRASFLFGNYITLSNLAESDWERIIAQRLSPLYISVHATEPALRRSLLGNPSAPDILEQVRRLGENGIRMHTQIVLCPGINDGTHLARTIEDLAACFPAVQSIAVVPAGLTSYRSAKGPIRTFFRKEARAVVEDLERRGAAYKKRYGTRLVFPSDELYLQAGRAVPRPAFYEDFPQIENGVGMVAAFLRDAGRTRFPRGCTGHSLSVVTGASFAPLLKAVLARVAGKGCQRVRVVEAKNVFFGPSVTVAGLLTGSDILRAVKGKRLGSMLLIPAVCLKDDEALFLDGMSLRSVEQEVGVPVRPADGPADIAAALREGRSGNKEGCSS